MNNLKKYPTHQPSLEELAELFNKKLKEYFENVEVSVSDCPNLTEPPFNLVARGLSSKDTTNKVIDVGGEKFLAPIARLDKPDYNIVQIAKDSGFANRFHILGAACGPFRALNHNSELIPNVSYENDHISNGTKCVFLPKCLDGDPEYVVQQSPNTCFNILGK